MRTLGIRHFFVISYLAETKRMSSRRWTRERLIWRRLPADLEFAE